MPKDMPKIAIILAKKAMSGERDKNQQKKYDTMADDLINAVHSKNKTKVSLLLRMLAGEKPGGY